MWGLGVRKKLKYVILDNMIFFILHHCRRYVRTCHFAVLQYNISPASWRPVTLKICQPRIVIYVQNMRNNCDVRRCLVTYFGEYRLIRMKLVVVIYDHTIAGQWVVIIKITYTDPRRVCVAFEAVTLWCYITD